MIQKVRRSSYFMRNFLGCENLHLENECTLKNNNIFIPSLSPFQHSSFHFPTIDAENLDAKVKKKQFTYLEGMPLVPYS